MSREQLSLKVSNLLDACLSKPDMTENKLVAELATNRTNLWRWRKGKHLPRTSLIKKICEIGAVDYNTFVTVAEENPLDSFIDIESLIKNYRLYLEDYPLQVAYCLHLCAAYVVENLRAAGLYTKTIFQDFPPTSKSANCTITITFKDADFFDLCLSIYGDLDAIHLKYYKHTSSSPTEEVIYSEVLNEKNIQQLINLIQLTP